MQVRGRVVAGDQRSAHGQFGPGEPRRVVVPGVGQPKHGSAFADHQTCFLQVPQVLPPNGLPRLLRIEGATLRARDREVV